MKPALKSNNQGVQATNQMQKFHALCTAIENHEKVSCKIRLDDVEGRPAFSSRVVLEPVSIQFDTRHILIECHAAGSSQTYPLCQMIDVELEE